MTTREVLDQLRAAESRNITFIEPDGSWPIAWDRASGVHVEDADGKRYLDLTGAFGVAAAGHANPRVVRAGQRQMAKLLHAMGDVHPHALKARLARELSRITFERWSVTDAKKRTHSATDPVRPKGSAAQGKTIFCNSGSEAVEAALKTAILATGKPGVIAFEGAYHGLCYGALNATHRMHFREPFRPQLGGFGHFLPFPVAADARRRKIATATSFHHLTSAAARLFRREKIGAILVEPIQGRGGVNIPPPEFLPLLRTFCDQHGALLILDEIYTGFGRTGKWFACEHTGVVPDLVCLGKALTGGFPLSACVGRAGIMDAAWPASTGEAIHTSTYLGHPVGCAMALVQIAEIRRLNLVEHSVKRGERLRQQLQLVAADVRRRKTRYKLAARTDVRGYGATARGLGLMAGLELRRANGSPASEEAFQVIKAMLRRGYILLPEGAHGNVISFTPPLTITEAQLTVAVHALGEEIRDVTVGGARREAVCTGATSKSASFRPRLPKDS